MPQYHHGTMQDTSASPFSSPSFGAAPGPLPLVVLTGASHGMGLAMARQLLQGGHALVTLSRGTSSELEDVARHAGMPLAQWPQDLADGAQAAARLRAWLESQPAGRYASAALINNAGVVPRIAPLADSDPADLASALRIGLEAPMQLTAAFLAATRGWGVPRKVLNISSGLGRRPMASQSAYCAAKAGMDHFTRCLALDEARQPGGARVCSLAPGVIDTDMQVHLRGADPQAFPDVQNFAQLKVTGMLTSPDEAAARVLAWLARPDFGDAPVADVREA
ncbi:SDR family NAD(P)-dependent oxidoreductase [Paracidovorax avenae]|uniref:SDR family NAD(P)-dependent oxidoreductase n=1 Tax=Paracidovorax avenae TaxID=80867 RepID=UPI000D16BAC6|nr:SDR family NAD(P)-dependent oxidoreductase [Paracidovorax avenae]AVS95861.1 short-chain dehydrogenase [Paracidovorax avenae]AVT09388.1 short-chain dehydrogenase [Paracidovorax avenae]AVT20306.1 short-chain dehydrogenase [Paracidovorax avenae]